MKKSALIPVMLLLTVATIIASCKGDAQKESNQTQRETTLYGNTFLNGKVSSIVAGNDSTVFIYGSEGCEGCKTYNKGTLISGCVYEQETPQRLNKLFCDHTGKNTSRSTIEYNSNKKITIYRSYGYTFPDTANMVMLYLRNSTYDESGHITSSFEYFSDGTPNCNYSYSYDNEGTETRECYNAVTGDIIAITKTKFDKRGNPVEVSENMPSEGEEWYTRTIEYQYDNNGNWTEKITHNITAGVKETSYKASRKIYYAE